MSLLHSGSHRRQAGGEETREERREERREEGGEERREEGGEERREEETRKQRRREGMGGESTHRNSSVTTVHRGEVKDAIKGDSPS